VRDPARIDRILRKLRAYWQANPDLRLGQIVVNAGRMSRVPTFYQEDDVTEDGIPDAAALRTAPAGEETK
jgi:uncharacterized protein YihD (DUF1040 family)